MNDNNLFFRVGNRLIIEALEYLIEGYISFFDEAANYRWTEYKLSQIQSNEIKWLSVDQIQEQYTLYSETNFKIAFKEENLLAEGYKQVETGTARVVDYSGDVDVDFNESVYYKEFEDSNQSNIVAIEEWGATTEYSVGHYISKEEVKGVMQSPRGENLASKYNGNKTISSILSTKLGKLILIGVVGILILIGVSIFFFNDKKVMSEYIESSPNFSYASSITSDGEQSEKADAYQTSLSIELASKDIIDGIDGDVVDVQENPEDSSVAILTKDEYCIVYSDEAGQTLAQVSTRLYAYSSTQSPYHSRMSAARYFRMFYYSRGFTTDSSRYSSNRNAYSGYNDGTINSNSSDKYKTYSDTTRSKSKSSGSSSGSSTRQGSSGSRTSSGGGTSAGK